MKKIKKRWPIVLLLLALVIILAVYPTPPQVPIQYYERETGQIETEKVAGEKWLLWLYYNPVGEATLWTLAKRKFLSSLYGQLMDHSSSAKKIAPFVTNYAIDMNMAQKQKFRSFNDFFTRELKPDVRPIDSTFGSIVSPADGKILAYESISNADFIVKGVRFDVTSFLNAPELSPKYLDGSMLVIRLAPVDYHRFHFPVEGTIMQSQKITGAYYSVSPYALRKKAQLFCENKREYTVISSPLFGNVVMAEVGATMVGSIVQTYEGSEVLKGEEKGYFKFGGSTVVLLFEKNSLQIDEDLVFNTSRGFETTVHMGEKIGELFKE